MHIMLASQIAHVHILIRQSVFSALLKKYSFYYFYKGYVLVSISLFVCRTTQKNLFNQCSENSVEGGTWAMEEMIVAIWITLR